MNHKHTIRISDTSMRSAVVGALTFLVVLVVCYVYFVSTTIAHVVMRKEIMREMNHLHTEVSELEAAYIEKQHGVANEIATLDGFHTVTEKIFIPKADTSVALRPVPLQ